MAAGHQFPKRPIAITSFSEEGQRCDLLRKPRDSLVGKILVLECSRELSGALALPELGDGGPAQ
jgi:hypothetical protein